MLHHWGEGHNLPVGKKYAYRGEWAECGLPSLPSCAQTPRCLLKFADIARNTRVVSESLPT